MIADLLGLSDNSFVASLPQEVEPESEKSSYLADYKNDVFVSYSHIDDKSLTAGQKGWIANFHQALEIRLEQLLGSDTKIWRDDKVKKKAKPTEKLDAQFPSAAIMISVVSPQYVKSPECVQEVKDFYAEAEQGTGLWISDRARIFKAVKTQVPRESQPSELQGIPDYDFFRFDPATGRPQEFWPELGAEANRNFWLKLEDIAYDIYQLIETIKTGKGQAKDGTNVSDLRTLYLAEASIDVADQRDKIKRQLQQRGYTILPDRPQPIVSENLQKQIQADLERCNFSIHLVGGSYGIVPEGDSRSIAEIQYELAIDRSSQNGFSRLIWMPSGLQEEDERQKRFVASLKQGAFGAKRR